MEKIPVTTIHAETISLASLGNDTAKKIEEAVRTSPVEARPIVCVPNPEWLLGRLSKSLRAGVLLKGVAPSPGELCLLVNEVGPAGHEEAKVWGLVTLGAPVEASEDEWTQLLASGLVKVSSFETIQKMGGGGESVEVPILKSDEMKRLVYGPALIPSVFKEDGTLVEGEADAQGDVVTAENIETAAHDYLERYNESSRTGFMHTAFNKDIRVVESYILPVEMKFGNRTLPKGTWMIVMRVLDDAVWAKVLSKEITGFSIGGVAKEYRLFGKEGEKDE